jgi:type I restriction enzyme, S subunit
MSFPRYPKYKASGVEWLGAVPEHWDVTPLKHVVNLRSGGTPSKTNLAYWDGDVPWASSKDLKSELLADTQDHITDFALEDGAASLVPAGSLLIVVRGMILAHTFPVVKALVPMAINQDLKAVTPNAKLTVDYLAWVLRGASRETISRLDEAGHGTKALRMEAWTSIPLPVPPLPEQTRIAAFLDQETAKIDALVAEQRRLMELLKEKRQAVISYAVTRGLNPEAALKPSGIEWLGDVPEHWVVKKMKWVAEMQSGHTPDKKVPGYWDDGDIPWVSLNDTGFLKENDYISETAYNISQLGVDNSSARVLPERVVVFSRDATIGRCAITTRPMAVSQHFIAWVCGAEIIPEYLLSRLRAMTRELDRLTTGATLKTIGMPDVSTLVTPVPPLAEQQAIIEWIAESSANIDTLTAEAQRAIDLLQERRTALISAAVTGQIDLRRHIKAEAT